MFVWTGPLVHAAVKELAMTMLTVANPLSKPPSTPTKVVVGFERFPVEYQNLTYQWGCVWVSLYYCCIVSVFAVDVVPFYCCYTDLTQVIQVGRH